MSHELDQEFRFLAMFIANGAPSMLEQKLRVLVHVPSFDIDRGFTKGAPLLHFATDEGRAEAVAVLLHHGADVNKSDYEGRTALHKAAIGGRTDIMRILLEHGAAPEMRDTNGDTAEGLALRHGQDGAAKTIRAAAGSA